MKNVQDFDCYFDRFKGSPANQLTKTNICEFALCHISTVQESDMPRLTAIGYSVHNKKILNKNHLSFFLKILLL